jgi:hypothetical protein
MLDWQCKLKQHCPFLILGEPSFFFLGQHFLLGPGFAGETDISCSLSTSAPRGGMFVTTAHWRSWIWGNLLVP